MFELWWAEVNIIFMTKEIRQQAEEIAKDFNLSVKERTDKLLRINSEMIMNTGTDSSKTEKKEVKQTSKFIFKQIKGFNEVDGDLLLRAIDE
jgi:hypothetical protein